MNNNFSSKKGSRWVIIGITYAVCFFLSWIAFRKDMVALALITTILFFAMGLPLADKVVTRLYNSILGGVTLFGPLQMFVGIFLIKLVARVIVASLVGQFVAPYTIGKAIADRLGVE